MYNKRIAAVRPDRLSVRERIERGQMGCGTSDSDYRLYIRRYYDGVQRKIPGMAVESIF